MAFAEGGLVDQSVDAAYNLHDQLQAVVMKSVKGVGEAMQEGPPPSNDQHPWTRDDLNQIRQKNADLLNRNNTLAQQQQQLANLDAQLLSKLPPNDPRRAGLSAELKQIASQMPETRKQVQNFTNKVAESNAAIDGFRQHHDPTYVPSKTTTAVPAPTAAPAEPPKTDDGGSTDNGLDALKQKEAAQEAAARALGKEREAAVNKYLDDPSAENRAEAEAIKQRLNGTVDDLNGLRGQVDALEGTSRPSLHVRSATGIAKEHRRKRSGGTNTDGSETQNPSGGGCGVSGTERHNPDGSDASNSYQDVGPGGSNVSKHHKRSAGGGHSQHSTGGTRQKAKANVASSENHHHAAGGANMPNNQQTMPQQKKNNQQRKRQAKNR